MAVDWGKIAVSAGKELLIIAATAAARAAVTRVTLEATNRGIKAFDERKRRRLFREDHAAYAKVYEAASAVADSDEALGGDDVPREFKIAVVLMPYVVLAGEGSYEGDKVGGKPHGRGYVEADDITYVGDWHHGKPHGLGVFEKGDMAYVGEWRDGKPLTGVLTWEGGKVTYHGSDE